MTDDTAPTSGPHAPRAVAVAQAESKDASGVVEKTASADAAQAADTGESHDAAADAQTPAPPNADAADDDSTDDDSDQRRRVHWIRLLAYGVLPGLALMLAMAQVT